MDNSLLITLVTLGVVGLFLVGVPIFLVIALWVTGVSLVIDFTLANIGVTLFEGLNFFGLLSLPLFILTGDLIASAGIATRLANFAHACLSWMRGGLGLATIGSCGLFAAISGSNSATTATIGGIMHPLLVKDGYDTRFAAATAAAGGTVGIIIPPSIIFIVYGFLMNLSISDLFLAGIMPGMLMVIAMQVVCWWMCRKNGWGSVTPLDMKRVFRTARQAYLGFFAIFIVIFGIYSGIFSPTEAAAITVGFCLVAGLLITREIKWKALPDILLRSGQLTGMLAPMIAVSIVMQQVFGLLGVADTVAAFIAWFGSGDTVVLLVCMAIVMAAGCILESLPVTVIFAPILAPIAVATGVDPVHFSVIFLVGAAIGFITPPFGLNLFVASGVTGIPYSKLVRFAVMYMVGLVIAWLLIAFVPWLSLGLSVN
ncbi:TRAP transporter permease DctM [Parazoarcus communis]|mgnify:FL=1|uniref:TRAP transporter large permease protein n=1 Tax=Parazoarcus communis TaxID=41977 RepID=A0A2U8H0J5_9RHOO|nr:TRAP transporter large permease [Parazoarcus communis]AWI79140.1 TRAP transporter permease DctM [Parazoarcus communis]|tara:strand:+ start:718 stop:1998 length:1281 start_codon:yes stop_codon:yes gene_type:complete